MVAAQQLGLDAQLLEAGTASTRSAPSGSQQPKQPLSHCPSHQTFKVQVSPARGLPGPSQPRRVSKSQFKAHALELFRQVEASGESLVVTDHGRPALEVRPYRPIDSPTADPLEALRGSKDPRLSPWAESVVRPTVLWKAAVEGTKAGRLRQGQARLNRPDQHPNP